MSLFRKLLTYSTLALFIPQIIHAQDGKFEINAGISTAGTYMLTDYHFFGSDNASKWSDGTLNDLKEVSYNSKVYPSISAEMSYKLSDDGILRRWSLVGMAGLHFADYESISTVSKQSDKQTAIKADALLGVRFRIVEKSHLIMYSQALAGIDFRNGSDYWTVTDKNNRQSSNRPVYQLTFLGFRVKLGHKTSHLGFLTELGYGSEYALSESLIILSPGMRAGISYIF